VPAAVGVSVAVPLVGSDPLQPEPDAVQDVPPLSDHVRVADAPSTIEVALKARVGACGTAVTLRLTEAGADTVLFVASVQASV
jgi:hypothetical protein